MGRVGSSVLHRQLDRVDGVAERLGLALSAFSTVLISVTIGIAVLRFRLYDIDVVINRTAVYVVLSGCIVGLYVAVVSTLGALFQASSSLLLSLIATGLVAPRSRRCATGCNGPSIG